MYKIKTTDGEENSIAVLFPAKALENLGISAGDEIEVTKTENALILRSTKEAERAREIEDFAELAATSYHLSQASLFSTEINELRRQLPLFFSK